MSTDGLYLGGVRELEDIRLRCRINDDGCWIWAGSLNQAGMPQVRIGARTCYAHRVAYTLGGKAIPTGYIVYHACGKTACCNPAHLRTGKRGAQQLASFARGTHARGMKHALACRRTPEKLTEEAVREIRSRYAAGESPNRFAAEYGVHFSHAYRIARGEVRKGAVTGSSVFDLGRVL